MRHTTIYGMSLVVSSYNLCQLVRNPVTTRLTGFLLVYRMHIIGTKHLFYPSVVTLGDIVAYQAGGPQGGYQVPPLGVGVSPLLTGGGVGLKSPPNIF